MLSSLSGGGIGYKLELEIIRSPSTSWASQSSSPSSTLSENSNSPVAISTRKPRTPRKRPNQTYNEAAALLSTAYPKIFSATLRNPPCKFTGPNQPFSASSDLLLPFSALDGGCDGFLLQSPVERILNRRPAAPRKLLAGCGSPREIDSNSLLRFEDCDDFEEDFESESILDEEIEEGGIDSIMGKLSESNDSAPEAEWMRACYGFPIGMGFKAIKQADNGDWWRFPIASINVADITPKAEKSPPPATEKKKKKKKVEKPAEFRVNDKDCSSSSAQSASKEEESSIPKPKSAGLLLKLNYDSVLTEWTDRPSPFSDESPCSDAAGTDVQARLAQIDLFLESGVREASVLRYKEKRRTRLFSKKIRYQVRKVNADRRPRMKGRFVKSPNSPDDSEQG
ncbi:PREDICTED: protein CHLOROPLAST IMPORT APPARATUS 2-like [Ipomoea nil]|uniref:protein CHLOROPLAST IMPORT APPARATUS 2-like n=1 Tax=Ipomoea nil TaxID=35883 RepID=UPI00090155E5|nr:PREDICTED: protein CHLOROPLAST IMPORT APPARATUS 2-like [Ipomoea nil]